MSGDWKVTFERADGSTFNRYLSERDLQVVEQTLIDKPVKVTGVIIDDSETL